MDLELRKLRRAALEADPWARFRYRVACIRAGQPELAGFEVGDIVLIDEVESVWIRHTWHGEVIRIFEAGDMYVRPVEGQKVRYRIRPLAKGLYLTREDRKTLVMPVQPGGVTGLVPTTLPRKPAQRKAPRRRAASRRKRA